MSTAIAHNHPEQEERIHLKKDRPKGEYWEKYSESDRQEIERLTRIQELLRSRSALKKSWSDKDFTEGTSVSANVWYQIKNGDYPPGKREANVARKLAELDIHTKGLIRQAQAAETFARRPDSNAQFVEFAEWRMLTSAIEVCNQKAEIGDEDRFIGVIGGTGFGKSTMARELMWRGYGTWHIKARPGWGASYFEMCVDIAAKLGLGTDFNGEGRAEYFVLEKLRKEQGVLVFEEVEMMHRKGVNLLRTILNETTCTVVMFMTPSCHNNIVRYGGDDAAQLFRRTEVLVEMNKISAAQVAAFAPRLWEGVKKPEADPRLKAIADLANETHAFDAIREITARLLHDLDQTGKKPDIDAVNNQIIAYRTRKRGHIIRAPKTRAA